MHHCYDRIMFLENRKLTSVCPSFYSVSEMKMEDILSVLTKDDCFKGRRGGGQVSFIVDCACCSQI